MLIGQSRFAFALVALALTAFSGTANAAATDLRLWVDVDGTAYLENTTDQPVSFDGYQIASEAKDLDPAGWDSISDRIPGRITELIAALGAGALSFGEANPSSANLAELNLGGVATLPAKGKFSLGRPFADCPNFYWSAPGTGAQDGTFCGIPEPSTWLLATLAGLALAGSLCERSASRCGVRAGGWRVRRRTGFVAASSGKLDEGLMTCGGKQARSFKRL